MVLGGAFSSAPEKIDINYKFGRWEKAGDHVPELAFLAQSLSVSDPPRLLLTFKLCKKGDFLFLHSITSNCENLFHNSIIQRKCLLIGGCLAFGSSVAEHPIW